ncbi:MAG: glycosyltransferase [Candidatus Pacebacteria bacterium]|nr:glycosyltransferase [Candidatus Paceibacterota bacterium]
MIKKIFTIVIPTLNEEKYLPRLLNDIAKQTFPKDLFEVIHVDGNSDDKTVEVASEFSEEINLKSIVVNKRNVSFQRNTGAEKAKGEWIIFMDADNQLPTYFLDGIKYQLAKNKKTDIFTTWSAAKKITSIESSITRLLNIGLEVYNSSGKPSAFGAMIGVKKPIMDNIKFDETQKFMEDTFFVQSVHDAGHQFSIFQEPRYIFSMRRYRQEGTFKFVSNGALLQLKFLQGKEFKDEERYKMDGGTYYDKIAPSLFKNIISQAKKMPLQQLKMARKILKNINEELGV